MITEDYVSFEAAKLLKEKSAEFETDCFYSPEGRQLKMLDDRDYKELGYIQRPSYQMAMKWLRKEHNLYIRVDRASKYWHYTIRKLNPFSTKDLIYNVDFKTSEEANEAAIKYCLENLI